MEGKLIKLQSRPHTAAIAIPVSMLPGLGDDVEYFEARQYHTGKITLWPVHGVVK